MKTIYSLALLLLLVGQAFAQPDRVTIEGSPIVVETDKTSLVFAVGQNKKLYQLYWGEKLKNGSDYAKLPLLQEAYMPAGTDNLFEPAIKMVHNDGNPSLELLFSSINTKKDGNVTTTIITLKDPQYPVEVKLNFAAYFSENVVKSWSVISHREKKAVEMTNYASSMLHLNAGQYWLTHFNGDWAKEMRREVTPLPNGITTIDSKLGTRANIYRMPLFLLSKDCPATETTGEVIAANLAWTGSFRYDFEIDNNNSLRIISGINHFGSEYWLNPNEEFVTPELVFTYSANGTGEASRNLHRWARNWGILDGNGNRLTLLNNWEATYFTFDEEVLTQLFDGAKNLGVDLFLLDDGWFANKYPRNNDGAGLGDWQPNVKKLPHGLGYLVEKATEKGIKFGIWIEPEMVNPKSELYEKHPEWVLKLPNRAENYYRNQLVLDLTNPEVQEFVYNMVDGMLTQNPGIAFIKWDCNRMMTSSYSNFLKEKQSHLQIDYVHSFYKIMERLRAKYPTLPIMLCSGGGGRSDYGALKYFTEFWPSDNTDGLERVYIQWEYSAFFPAISVCNHITTWGKQSLKYRTDVAMMGKMGYDIRVAELSPEELKFSQSALKNYERLKEVIWRGDLFRLISPYNEQRAVLMYVDEAKSHAVLFSYALYPRTFNQFAAVRLQGLAPDKLYKVEEINRMESRDNAQHSPGPSRPAEAQIFSGDYLMKVGISLPNNNPLTSAVIEITEVK